MPGLPFPTVGRVDLTSPPYRRSLSLQHRYYCQLRLPNAHLRSVRYSLSSPDTLHRPSLFVIPFGLSGKRELSSPKPGFCLYDRLPQPFCTGKRSDLPSSQVTPVITCPYSDPGGVLITCLGAMWTVAFRHNKNVGFHLQLPEGYPKDHNYENFEAQPRGLQSRSIRLRTPVTGFTLGFRYWTGG